GADPLARADRVRLPDEDEEGGLEGVLGGVPVAQDAAADAQHHRAVAAHQRRERGRLAPRHETNEQLAVAQARPAAPQHGPAQVLDDGRHAIRPPAGCGSPPPSTIATTAGGASTNFRGPRRPGPEAVLPISRATARTTRRRRPRWSRRSAPPAP